MHQSRDLAKVSTQAPTDKFAVLSFVWNGPKESQQLFVVTGKGERYDSPEGVARKEALEVIGISFGDAHDEKRNLDSGEVLEFLVYDRALHTSERTEIEDHYRHKYFKE